MVGGAPIAVYGVQEVAARAREVAADAPRRLGLTVDVETRAAVRKLHEDKGATFLEIHVATPVEVCSQRDVKGLYAKQVSGSRT